MSKEQTPIEWLRSKLCEYQILEKEDLELFDMAIEKERQYAQYREKKAVLEALERYQDKLSDGYDQESFEWHRQQLKNYIENEVKPKYELNQKQYE